MWIERVIAFGCAVSAAFLLGFMFGKAYLKRKMRRREEEEKLADYLPGKIKPIKPWPPPPKEDDDTKTDELETEKITQGNPKGA